MGCATAYVNLVRPFEAASRVVRQLMSCNDCIPAVEKMTQRSKAGLVLVFGPPYF
jgi:hypothetical protein